MAVTFVDMCVINDSMPLNSS